MAETGAAKTPADFLKSIKGKPVVVKLNSGVDYRGALALGEPAGRQAALGPCRWTLPPPPPPPQASAQQFLPLPKQACWRAWMAT